MRQLIAGNWKMNGRLADGAALVGKLQQAVSGLECDVLICPPATLLHTLAAQLAGSAVQVGGQDCHTKVSGAHTGDISAAMLRDAGAAWVILGHSERRTDHGESDAMVQAKTRAAVAAGLSPIVCVGETEAERVAGAQDAVVGGQLIGSLPQDFAQGYAGVVAYEPVWAIGTGRTPSEADVAQMHAHIRKTLVSHLGEAGRGVRILYGGSVKPSNAAALLALPDVGGALVGGAALVADDFAAIAHASHAVAAAARAG
ncbi:MAG: triose-phosphate isomerase [Acetobacteraceae bacterium]|nr:triose-phosphate isomerase [Acetobacteraceae bacterium]